MRKEIVRAALFLVFWGLFNSLGCSKKTETYYPLKEGLTWEYQFSMGSRLGPEGSAKMVITNLAARELKGKKVIPRKYDVMGKSVFSFIAEDANGLYEFATQGPNDVEPEVQPTVYFIKYPIQPGTIWEDRAETSRSTGKLPITLKSTIEGIDEVVTVPAGTFKGCMKVKQTGATKKNLGAFMGVANITVEKYGWYAPGVGTVKLFEKEKSDHLMVASSEASLQLESFKK